MVPLDLVVALVKLALLAPLDLLVFPAPLVHLKEDLTSNLQPHKARKAQTHSVTSEQMMLAPLQTVTFKSTPP